MGEINRPAVLTRYITNSVDDRVLIFGSTQPNQRTSSGQPEFVAHPDHNLYLADLTARYVERFDALPGPGEQLDADAHYVDRGEVVVVRRPHIRTGVDPDGDPDNWVVEQAEGTAIVWAAGERARVGMIRAHLGIDYRCARDHETELGLEPLGHPQLWAVHNGNGGGR